MKDMNSKATTKNNKVLSIAGITAGTVFMAAAYYLPVDSFMGLFAAGLFLIPTAFFVYMVQKMEKGDDNVQATR
jgi:hypothetical protein